MSFPTLGQAIILEVARQDMVKVSPREDGVRGLVFRWSGNAPEQLEAVVSEWIAENRRRRALLSPSQREDGTPMEDNQ